MLPVSFHIPVTGSYSSALVKKKGTALVDTEGDQHLPIRQERRPVGAAGMRHAAGCRPQASRGLIKFRACQALAEEANTRPSGSNVTVWLSRALAMLPVTFHLPGARAGSNVGQAPPRLRDCSWRSQPCMLSGAY